MEEEWKKIKGDDADKEEEKNLEEKVTRGTLEKWRANNKKNCVLFQKADVASPDPFECEHFRV